MATLKDIAEKCNVSVAAVSLVLNDKPNRISETVKKDIIATAKELNYQPNQVARSLSKGKSNIIGLIIPDIRNNHFANILAEIEELLTPSGYNIMVGNSNDEAQSDLSFLRSFVSYNVDGLIVVTASNHTEATLKEIDQILIDSKIPIVFLDRDPNIKNYSSFTTNNRLGGYLATKHLISLGHKRIGCLTGPLKSKSAYGRYQGFLDALKEFDLFETSNIYFEGDYKIESGIASFPYFLRFNATAIFSSNDIMAIGLNHAAQSHNLTIPKDLSIVGFDDIDLAKLMYPTLTTVSQPVSKIIKNGCQTLLYKIRNKSHVAETKIYDPELIIRDSTYPPKKLE